MIKCKIVLEKISDDNENDNIIALDLSELDSNYTTPVEVHYENELPASISDNDLSKFNIIGRSIRTGLYPIIEEKIKENTEKVEVKDEDLKEAIKKANDLPPDPNRVSELTVINKIVPANKLTGYAKKMILNGELLSTNDMVLFMNKNLNKIIIQGEPYLDEIAFDDTKDLSYEIFFDNGSLIREACEFKVKYNEEK